MDLRVSLLTSSRLTPVIDTMGMSRRTPFPATHIRWSYVPGLVMYKADMVLSSLGLSEKSLWAALCHCSRLCTAGVPFLYTCPAASAYCLPGTDGAGDQRDDPGLLSSLFCTRSSG